MKAIKFVQWQSSILVGVIVFAGLVCLFTKIASIQEFVSFATVCAIFVGPEKVAAFFGPALKRRQEQRQEGGGNA